MSKWQPIETAPTAKTASYLDGPRVLLWVPPYGPTTGHFADGRWCCHSILNKEAQPTMWAAITPPEQS